MNETKKKVLNNNNNNNNNNKNKNNTHNYKTFLLPFFDMNTIT